MKRVMNIPGYTISLPIHRDCFTVMVDTCGSVVEFEEVNGAQLPILISALEADENIDNYVVADYRGPYVLQ